MHPEELTHPEELQPRELLGAAVSSESVKESLEESLAKNREQCLEPRPADPSHAGLDRPCSG
jgi:hypothetical protein